MTQEDILKIITTNPGMELLELKRKVDLSPGTVLEQVSALVRKGQVRRQPGRNRKIDKLFPV